VSLRFVVWGLCALPQSTPSRSLPDPLQRLSPLPHTFRPLSQVRIRQLPRSTVTTWIETLPQSLTILLHPLQRRPPPRRPTATPARARTSAQLPTLSTWRSSRFAEGLGFPSRILVLGSVRCWGLSIDVAQLQGCRGFRVSIADFGIGVCALRCWGPSIDVMQPQVCGESFFSIIFSVFLRVESPP
jgi:hypothetical protein